jgi:hypothetical protein
MKNVKRWLGILMESSRYKDSAPDGAEDVPDRIAIVKRLGC